MAAEETPSPAPSPPDPLDQTFQSTTSICEDVDELAINELFTKDPRELSDADLRRVVAEFRKVRARWEEEERSSRTESRRSRPSKGVKQKVPDIDLDDLEL